MDSHKVSKMVSPWERYDQEASIGDVLDGIGDDRRPRRQQPIEKPNGAEQIQPETTPTAPTEATRSDSILRKYICV